MRLRVLCVVFVLLAAAACGGGNGSTSPSPIGSSSGSSSGGSGGGSGGGSSANGTVSFKVDGTTTTASLVTATYSSGILAIGATDMSRPTTLGFAVTPSGAGTGTYTLGPLSPANALIQIGNPAQGWQAGVGIGSGSVTITALTTTGATGTFAFSLAPVAGSGATGTKAVTEGAFNVTFSSR